MLQISGKDIVDARGEKVFLRGIALGGWLMMEGYMLGGENIPETKFRDGLAAQIGEAGAEEFNWEFRRRFFTEQDADRIKKLGINCVRIPFNHKLIEISPFKIDSRSMEFLKTVVSWFAEREIYVILDMHAVPGCQNRDWHSDSEGEMDFYTNPESRERFVYLWKELSGIFKDEEWVAGYDIMNEPVVRNPDGGGGDARAANLAQGGPAQTGNPELEVLKDAFRAVIKAVRENGDQHIIFLEGHQWAQRVEFLADMVSGGHAAHCGGNVALSVHFYEPTEFTFNTDPTLHYPGKVHGKLWDRAAIKQYLSQYAQYNVPVYVGEFGVSAGDTAAADTACPAADDKYRWVAEVVSVMCDLGYHWTYWTYKSVAGMPWPDGLYQISEYFTGMKNVGRQLAADKGRFYENLDTSRFKLNHRLLDLLQK